MRATIVYESMFGSTREVAEAIARGLGGSITAQLVPVAEAPECTADEDLLIVGAPTHVHGLSRPASREEAVRWADDPAKHLTLEPNAGETGVREWLEGCGTQAARFAAFDTRADMARILSGSASATIDKDLRRLGSVAIAPSESFTVDRQSHLEAGEVARAQAWGRELAAALTS
jgi:hypothetical protein